MTDEEKQIANERLAKLCGFLPENGYLRGMIDSPVRFTPVPDFYEDSPNGAYWREKAEAAILNKFTGRDARALSVQTWAWGYDEFRAQVQLEHEQCDGDSDEFITAEAYAIPGIARIEVILAALSAYEKETATP